MNVSSYFVAGVVFAPKVRREGYVTIFDPFQLKFGKKMGAVLFFNELLANIFWEAAILGALGDIKLYASVTICVNGKQCLVLVSNFQLLMNPYN